MEKNNDYFDLDSIRDKEEQHFSEDTSKKSFYSGLIVGLTSALLIICVVFVATRMQKTYASGQRGIAPNDNAILTDEMAEKIQVVSGLIDYYYFEDDIDREIIQEGAYRGMVESLGDPYSEYYSQEEFQTIMERTEGIYYGIGAYVGTDPDTTLPKISGVIDNAPASEVDIRTDDIIYEVDGEPTYGYSLTEVVNRIKGDEGTKVTLTLLREGEAELLNVEVIRRRVESPTVSMEMMEDNTAYIRITEFDTVTTAQFSEALTSARESGMNGLILDLRDNPGGNLHTVVDIARMILPEGMIVYTEDKYGKGSEYTCDGKNQLEVPLVVLINGNSASASEILAGSVKDYGIGTLVGTTTFGKGIVQQLIPLEDESALKLTISSYFTPNGNDIHGIGVAPDVECIFDRERYYSEERFDNQLEEAKMVLNKLKN